MIYRKHQHYITRLIASISGVQTGRKFPAPRDGIAASVPKMPQADLSVHCGVDKAVYVFPSEHYSWFQDALQQDAYSPGQFGENLTTLGLL